MKNAIFFLFFSVPTLAQDSRSFETNEVRVESNGNYFSRTESFFPAAPSKKEPKFRDIFSLFEGQNIDNSEKHTDRRLAENKPRAGSMRLAESSQSVFFTYHSDSKCASPFFDTHIPTFVDNEGEAQSLKLNKCLGEEKFNAKFACKIGTNKYTLFKKSFASSDTTCSAPLFTQAVEIYKHDYVCSRDRSGVTGGYLKVHCGEDSLLETTMPAMPYLSYPQVYSNSRCSSTGLKSYDPDTPPTEERHWLNVCTAKYSTPNLPETGVSVAYHYKMTAVSTSPLKIKVTRYAPNDPLCVTKKQERIYLYPEVTTSPMAMPACIKDPASNEFPNSFYLNSVATKPRIVGQQINGDGARYLLYKSFAKSDTTCSNELGMTRYQALGVCEKSMKGFVATGKSEKQVITNTHVLVYAYNDTSCSGPSTVDSKLLTDLGVQWGVCTAGSDRNEVVQLVSNPPDPNLRAHFVYYTSNAADCAAGQSWNNLLIQAASGVGCIPDYGTSGYSNDFFWGNPSYRKNEACAADGVNTVYKTYPESSCSSATATSTFFADTAGGLSDTLTIRGVRCMNEERNERCNLDNQFQIAIQGTGTGAAGFILEGMTLSWAGKSTSSSITLQTGSCRFKISSNPTDSDIATCLLSTSVNIPSNTLITGIITQDLISSTTIDSAQCSVNQYDDAEDDTQFYRRTRCGYFKDVVPTTVEGEGGTTPVAGQLVTSEYLASDTTCSGPPRYSTVENVGQCLARMDGYRPLGASYKEFIGSASVETHSYTTSNCSGSATKTSMGLSSKLRFGGIPFNALDVCAMGGSGEWRVKFSFSASAPVQSGILRRYYTSDNKCAGGAPVTFTELRDSGCSNGISSRGGSSNGKGWSYRSYDKIGSCTADGKGANYYRYADPTCTLSNATATFIADTGGISTNILTIRGIKCVDKNDPSKRCSVTDNYPSGYMISTAPGTTGDILEGMTLSWAGMPPGSSIKLNDGQCEFYWKNATAAGSDTATCQLNYPVNIPSGSFITGFISIPKTIRWTETVTSECAPAATEWMRNDMQSWFRESCGTTADTVGPTTIEGTRLNSITHNGIVYSTLADVSVDGGCCQSQSGVLKVPAGWRVAPNTTDIIQNVIKSHTWSTCNLYVGIKNWQAEVPGNRGFAYRTKTNSTSPNTCSGSPSWGSWSSNGNSYQIGGCSNAQILISKCPPGTYSDGSHNGDASTCTSCPSGKSSTAVGAMSSAGCV